MSHFKDVKEPELLPSDEHSNSEIGFAVLRCVGTHLLVSEDLEHDVVHLVMFLPLLFAQFEDRHEAVVRDKNFAPSVDKTVVQLHVVRDSLLKANHEQFLFIFLELAHFIRSKTLHLHLRCVI